MFSVQPNLGTPVPMRKGAGTSTRNGDMATPTLAKMTGTRHLNGLASTRSGETLVVQELGFGCRRTILTGGN